ncbi:MAG: ABC transporter ATP-binding protein [Haloarculaceae archaeon]
MTRPITVTDLRKSYGKATALDSVSLSFEPGTITGLVGPNGSGKTTLFRLLLGLTRPDAGTVSLPDVPVGCVFQEPQFFGDLTVDENLRVFGQLTDADPSWRDELRERCGLDPVVLRRADSISAGFAKRLDVALALIDRPGVVLLDEPFADVDGAHRERVRDLLAEYATGDRIMVVASHQFDVVASLLDGVAVLADGRVLRTESIDAVGSTGDDVATFYRSVLSDRD